jgi:hypothetical protein
MMKSRSLASLVLFASLVTACGGGGGGSGGLTVEQYATRVRDIVCRYDVQCGSVPDLASCYTYVDLGQAKADIASGITIYDGKAAAACLDVLDASDGCSLSRGLFASAVDASVCFQVAKGTLADGATCNADEQCVSGNCIINPALCDRGTTCCDGECRPTRVIVAEGGDCSGDDAWCGSGLYCDTSATTPTCAKTVALGAACTASSCAAGSYCLLAEGSTEGVCTLWPKRGEPCTSNSVSPRCDDGRDFCDPATNTCKARPGPGDSCTADAPTCLPLSLCDETSQKCVAKSGLGKPCADDEGCLGQLVCKAGACAAPLPRIVCP